MKVVDVHAHVIPPSLVAAMRAGTAPDGITLDESTGEVPWVVHRQGYRYPLLPAFHDAGARLAQMDRDGTDVALLSPAPPLFLYWAEPEVGREAAQVVNDGVAEMVASDPRRFAGVGTLPMADPRAAVEELRRAVRDLGLRGVQVGPHVEGTGLDDPSLRPVLAAAEELGVPVVVHPYYVGSAPGLLDDFYLTNLQGNPWQTALCASRLILSGALDDLPGLEVLLVHGGGHLPYQAGRLDHGWRVRPEARTPALPPSEYLRRFSYDSLTHSTEATRWLVETVGADRVLYGTDVPFDMGGGPFAEQLAAVTDETARRAVAHGNAARLFHLEDLS